MSNKLHLVLQLITPRPTSLRKHPFLLALRRGGRFAWRKRLRLNNRNSILMMQINVYIINPLVMGFQI